MSAENRKHDADVDAHILKSKAAMLALFQASTQDVLRVMQTPKAKGGKMPVDTGFLRSSMQTTINQPASDIAFKPVGPGSYDWNETVVTLTINKAKLGDAIYAVYTANYAAARNYGSQGRPGDLFVDHAASQWQSIVDKNVRLITS